MRWKLGLLVAIILGGLGGSWIKNLPSFVTVAYEQTTYEMRLWVAIFLITLFFVSLYFSVKLIKSFFTSGKKLQSWRKDRHTDSARKQTLKGVIAFIEGNWQAAEKNLIHASKNADNPVINYLVAAQTAQCLNAYVRRDSYLKRAHELEPKAGFAIGLTQAKLQLKQQQTELALATLTQLKNKNSSHPYVLKSLCQLFEQVKDWESLNQLLPSLKKRNILSQEDIKLIEEKCIKGQLTQEAEKGHFESLQNIWVNLPSAQRKSKSNILVYSQYLIQFQQMEEAEILLKPLFKKEADEKVLSLYGKILSPKPEKQLSFLESWYKSNPSVSDEIFLTLGKIAFHAKLWGKSRNFLEQAIQKKPSAEAYLFMAKNMEYLNNHKEAMEFYKKGLEFLVESEKEPNLLALPDNADDLISANLLPQFKTVESN
jgi:HemY protein